MNFLEHRFTLDVRRDASKVCVRVRKGDTARRLRIALVQGVVPYEIRSDCYAMFSAVKPDGNRLFNPCTIEDNRIVYELTPQTTAVIGLVECEIRLYGADDALITSPGFDLIVDEVLYDEDRVPQSETEVNALTGLISDAAEVIAEGRELIGDFGSALGQIEGVRDEAEAAARTAVAAAESAKTTAGEVAKQVQVAQDAATTAENANKGLDQKVAVAESARQSAETAAAEATEAESKAERALETALKTEERVLNAGSAAQSAANQAASDARTASVSASEAKQAAQNAESVRQAAVDAKERAEAAITSAEEAAQDAAKATAAAEEMVRSVQEDRAAAETAARNAEQAANSINTQLAEDLDERVTQTEKEILNLKQGGLGNPGSAGTVEIVDAVDRPPGSPPTVTETEDSTPAARKYILGIPAGRPGANGVGIRDTAITEAPGYGTWVEIRYTNGEEYTLTIPHGKDYILTPADKAEIAEMAAELVEVPEQDSSQNVDLTGYAKEQWVKDNYQPKGEYLTEETDPTVPSWAKQPTKPKYTAAEVGAIPDTTEIPVVPTKVSAFENDAGYLTEHQDLSGYAKTEDIPTTLPNPNALTFTGAATGTYDGSAPLTVNIPAGWGGTTPTTAEKIVDYAVDADSASATSFAFTVADYPKLAKYNHLRGIFRKSTNGSMPWVQVVLNAAAINHANRIGRMEPTSYGMCGFEITNNAGYYLGGVTDSYNPSMYSEWVMASFPDICNRRAFPLYLKELTMVSVSSYATFLDEGGKIEIWGWND